MAKSVKTYCPKCLEQTACRMITITSRVKLYGVDLQVEAKRLQCGACGYVIPQKELEKENQNKIVEMYHDITGVDLRLDHSESEFEFGNLH